MSARTYETRVSSLEAVQIIGHQRPVTVIGERINPTGRSALVGSLQEGDLSLVLQEACAQVKAGAHILDVNLGVPGADQEALMAAAVPALQQAVEVPLCLDSADPRVLEAGLRAYRGKALVNSVTGEGYRLVNVLPLVREHRAAVVGLLMDDSGIPETAEARFAVAEHIVARAAAEGISLDDIILDPLVLAIGADPGAGRVTLETIRLVRERLGVNVTLGVSNVSHGLPARPALNGAFVAMAVATGATCPIVNPLDTRMMETLRAADLCLGRDAWAAAWIRAFRAGRST